ncbi:hypothetical protein [Streptomyces sp. CAU 1734]|uniref:hypothetical protein n=1 Tax=Streptomyces sp. CAU 1734 TaxID=3140360 RepID=UPI0032602C05
MDLEALRFARFQLLDEAVADWSTMVTNLDDLEKEARDGLRGRANKANWVGVNATVSREFIGRTAGEFADARTQATSIRNILKDARDELRDWQRKLNEAIERGLGRNLTVTSTGAGEFTVTMNIHPDRAAMGKSLPDHSTGDVTALRDEIQSILDKATESDTSAAAVLKALADQADHGFSGARYADRDSAANAIREAEKLAALARKKPEDLTIADFDAINAGLGKYSGDELFASRFAERLGPKGTLEFWGGMNDPRRLDWELGSERSGRFDELQRNLGLTLAQATQSDTQGMTQWKREMVTLGGQPVSQYSSALGFQVMGNLMRWGNYDDQFLRSYGTELVTTEKKLTDNGGHGAWRRLGGDPLLNRTGTDSGWDPVVGFMKALSNSPDAATGFFNDAFVTKGEDHDFKDGKGRAELSNFDYFFEERDWPTDQDHQGADSIDGRNSMALALEAATTGHPAGQFATVDTPPHSAEQARLMENIVASISDDPARLTEHKYMGDSIGQIASEYLPDINRATADDKFGNTERLFPIVGAQADLSHTDVTRFLTTVGQSPQGFAAVEIGQAAYVGALMEYHLNPDLPADQRYPHPPQSIIESIANRTGEVSGTLAIGRQEAITGPAAQAASDFTNSVAQQKNTWSGAIGTGVGVGVSFIATPVGGAIASGVAGTVSSVVLEHVFQQSETDILKNAGREASKLWEVSMENSFQVSQLAAQAAAEKYGIDPRGQFTDWAKAGTEQGFNSAETNASRSADDLTTDIQPG